MNASVGEHVHLRVLYTFSFTLITNMKSASSPKILDIERVGNAERYDQAYLFCRQRSRGRPNARDSSRMRLVLGWLFGNIYGQPRFW